MVCHAHVCFKEHDVFFTKSLFVSWFPIVMPVGNLGSILPTMNRWVGMRTWNLKYHASWPWRAWLSMTIIIHDHEKTSSQPCYTHVQDMMTMTMIAKKTLNTMNMNMTTMTMSWKTPWTWRFMTMHNFDMWLQPGDDWRGHGGRVAGRILQREFFLILKSPRHIAHST